ncbi:hypothetical protein H4S02_004964 [Coemansia sp. RSA 2611]|nr:hypothetical protein H4S02_004964 [Coemansia sp. RSA 2611]
MDIPEKTLFNIVLQGFLAISLVIAGALMVVGSPYGSQTSYRGRLAINGQTAWIIMELVSPTTLLCAYLTYETSIEFMSASNALVALWLVHYANRAVVYPLRQPARKPMHIGIMLSAVVFNTINGYLNGRWLSAFAPAEYHHDLSGFIATHYLRVPLGLALFAAGMCGNVIHDNILAGLRRTGSKRRYSIPAGGLFGWVSCPHFFCEAIEWLGFAVLADSPAAWAFLLNVLCNLVPRAYFIHRWYLATFPDNYPRTRRAMIPFVL